MVNIHFDNMHYFYIFSNLLDMLEVFTKDFLLEASRRYSKETLVKPSSVDINLENT